MQYYNFAVSPPFNKSFSRLCYILKIVLIHYENDNHVDCRYVECGTCNILRNPSGELLMSLSPKSFKDYKAMDKSTTRVKNLIHIQLVNPETEI